MIIFLIRYFLIVFCSIYSYQKLLNIHINRKVEICYGIVFCLIISLITYLIPERLSSVKIIFLLFVLFISMTMYSMTKIYLSAIVSIISLALSYIALSLSGILLSIVFTPIIKALFLDNSYFIVIGSLLQCALIFSLFKIKRLRKGMPFILHSRWINIGTLSCLALLILLVSLHIATPSSVLMHTLALLFILFLAFLLLFWWRRRITLDYVQKLRMDEVESLYKKISDNEQEIEKLNTNNDYLSKVIHKDNKLIPAMEMALHSYLLEAPTMEAEEARQFGADLLSQLQSMSAEREGIISNYQKNTDFHPKIGIYSVDAVILYMEKRAEKFNITYNLRFDNDIKDAIVGFIHERDMLHLLSDLIENAIIAVKDASHREIFLHIGFLQGGLFIDLYDSGIPFEPAVYQDFGNCQHTTHADSGGSGIGLMDIWNLKRKYKASLQIYEYLPDSDIYTKKIRLLFDRRNHFLLQTYRDKEIRSFITRSDLHVFPLKEMKKKDKE